VARFIQREALTRRVKNALNITGDTHSAFSEIADNNNSRTVDDKIDKFARFFVSDVFAEDNDELINDG
jgi:hypothetical protein